MARDAYIRVGFSEQEMEAVQIKMAKVRAKTFQAVIHTLVMAWCRGEEASPNHMGAVAARPMSPLVDKLSLLISSEDKSREARAIRLLLEAYKPPEMPNEKADAETPAKSPRDKRGA